MDDLLSAADDHPHVSNAPLLLSDVRAVRGEIPEREEWSPTRVPAVQSRPHDHALLNTKAVGGSGTAPAHTSNRLTTSRATGRGSCKWLGVLLVVLCVRE